MSSYFDEREHRVSLLCQEFQGAQLLEKVAEVENTMIAQVLEDIGDEEFPDELRVRIKRIIDYWAIAYPPLPGTKCGVEALAQQKEAWSWLFAVKTSRLIDDMHSTYHNVAAARKKTRFGLLFDSPSMNLLSKREWEKEHP